MEKAKTKQVAKIAVFITSIFVIFLSATYAFINVTLSGTKRQVITAGDLSLVLEEDENNLTIENALPMYDEVGKLQEAFTFRLVNNGTSNMNYTIKLVDITTNTDKLSPSDVKYYLTKEGSGSPALLSSLSDGVIDSGIISGEQTINYTLRLWIRDGVTDNSAISGKSLSYRIDVDATQEVTNSCILVENGTDQSGANVPVLTSGMIPVVYDECEKTWKKADVNGKWYNYDTQNWANAVTVTEASRSTYMDAPVGTPISMDDINTMWVWIPRYEYQYTNLGDQYAGGTQEQPGEIKVNFIASSQTAPSDSSTYKIPEGFKFGEEELSGLWIGKFETTGSMSAACTDENCTTADISIKPNLSSLRNQTVSSLFYASRAMQNSTNANKYGFDVIGNGTMDIHMAKKTEWGIAAYLSQSKYGKYGNPSYTGEEKQVAINNCTDFITGIGGDSVSADRTNTTCTTNTYETEKGRAASSTGTIYGIYDMSGGGWDYVMGNYNHSSGQNDIYHSGFSGPTGEGPTISGVAWPDSKYYDLYDSDIVETAYKDGDATYETWSWYSDYTDFINSRFPWFALGGGLQHTFEAGVFANSINSGGYANPYYATRYVVKP